MARRDIGTDDPRVRVRPGRGSRPRTKQRPRHADAVLGMVTRIDRGHYRIRLDDPSLTEDSSGDITAMKARDELRTATLRMTTPAAVARAMKASSSSRVWRQT